MNCPLTPTLLLGSGEETEQTLTVQSGYSEDTGGSVREPNLALGGG
jgi:hypothetical protein